MVPLVAGTACNTLLVVFSFPTFFTLCLINERRRNNMSDCRSYLVVPTTRVSSHATLPAWPTLGEMFIADAVRGPSQSTHCNRSILDWTAGWHVTHCGGPLVPATVSLMGVLRGRVNVLLAVSERPDWPVLVNVERVLELLQAARVHGMVPAVFLGQRSLSPAPCECHVSPYHRHEAGG